MKHRSGRLIAASDRRQDFPTGRRGSGPFLEERSVRIVYSRVSTATQSLLRQRHILTEAGLLIPTEG